MLKRAMLFVSLGLCLSACSTAPDRYAFWRDGNGPNTSKPNLGDVPAAPNTQDAKAEMDTLRARLQQDRDNAYLAAQGIVPVQEPVATMDNNASPNNSMMEPAITSEEMPLPEMTPPAMQPMAAPMAPQTFDQNAPMPMSGGNVQYNYAATPGYETYVYGYSPVQINQQAAYQQQQTGNVMAANDSVSIDFSALSNDTPTTGLSTTMGMTGSGEPLVYFKHGSARLGALDKKRLADLAAQLKQRPSSVVIIGHASKPTGMHDPVAAEDVNLRMSARRASVVLQELARHGISADQVHMTAQGDSVPSAPQPGMTPDDADRRVEILFDR